MLSFLQQMFLQHSTVTGGITVWVVLSLLINVLLSVKGPQAWVDMAKTNPRAALVINILFRVFGVDLVSLIIHVRDFLNAKAVPSVVAAPKDPPAPVESEALIPVETEVKAEEEKK